MIVKMDRTSEAELVLRMILDIFLAFMMKLKIRPM